MESRSYFAWVAGQVKLYRSAKRRPLDDRWNKNKFEEMNVAKKDFHLAVTCQASRLFSDVAGYERRYGHRGGGNR